MRYPNPTDNYDCNVFCENFMEIAENMTALSEKDLALQANISRLREDLMEEILDVKNTAESRWTSTQGHFTSSNNLHTDFNTRLNDHNRRITVAENEVAELSDSVAGFQQSVNNVTLSYGALRELVVDTDTKCESTKTDVTKLTTRVAAEEEKSASASTSISTLTSDVAGLKDRVSSLEEGAEAPTTGGGASIWLCPTMTAQSVFDTMIEPSTLVGYTTATADTVKPGDLIICKDGGFLYVYRVYNGKVSSFSGETGPLTGPALKI